MFFAKKSIKDQNLEQNACLTVLLTSFHEVLVFQLHDLLLLHLGSDLLQIRVSINRVLHILLVQQVDYIVPRK